MDCRERFVKMRFSRGILEVKKELLSIGREAVQLLHIRKQSWDGWQRELEVSARWKLGEIELFGTPTEPLAPRLGCMRIRPAESRRVHQPDGCVEAAA
tara:strand:- start:201 stop:494 length:294 start_codon:yes stop_codon:yes gene_type:complete